MSTHIYTYTTVPDGQTRRLYDAKLSVKVSMRLDTAGPVAMGTRHDLSPLLSGKGVLLNSEDWTDFELNLGDRLFIIAETVERVQFLIQPNWQKIINETQKQSSRSIISVLRRLGRRSAPSPAPEELPMPDLCDVNNLIRPDWVKP